MTTKTITIATDFSPNVGTRLREHSDHSGEDFREVHLEPLFGKGDDFPIVIVMDGVKGFPSSFLDEAFGGLARLYGKDRVLARVTFVANDNPMHKKRALLAIENCRPA